MIGEIVEYGDHNIDIIHPPKPVENTKQKNNKKEATVTKKDKTWSKILNQSTSRKLRSNLC